jgi:hypothetical protein
MIPEPAKQGTEAMRNKLFAASLLALFPIAVVGCQSTSQMAWWKSAKKSDIESTAIAHSAAPQLPSEAAKQAEKLAATGAAGMIESNTFPSVAPAAYPTTGATGYPDSTVASVPASYPTTQVPVAASAASQVGAMAMPYDPSAVPSRPTSGAPVTEVAGAARSATQADRYGSSAMTVGNQNTTMAVPSTPAKQTSTPAYQTTNTQSGNPVANSVAGAGSGSKPSISSNPGENNPVAVAPAYAQAGSALETRVNPSQNSVSGVRGRYAMASQPHYASSQSGNVNQASSMAATGTLPATTPVAGLPYPTTTGELPTNGENSADVMSKSNPSVPSSDTQIASNGSYRPGGTGNYPGTAVFPSAAQVAARPGEAVSARLPAASVAPSQQSQTPGVADPLGTRYR